MFLRERGEIGAIRDLPGEILCLVLRLHEDMRGAIFGLLARAGIIGLEDVPNGRFGHRVAGHGGDHVRCDDGAPFVVEPELRGGGQVAVMGLHEQGLLHELIENPLEKRLRRHLIVLLRQRGAQRNRMAEGDLGLAHGGEHRVARQLFLRVLLRRRRRPGHDRDKAGGGKIRLQHRLILLWLPPHGPRGARR